ncbi:MAG: PIG-L deacetylase family protein [Verrucomicrobiales bacterium]|nr:PIG-L family deacetylase [Verrucomicrobiota bacterium JB025]
MNNPYLEFVESIEDVLQRAKAIEPSNEATVAPVSGSKVLIFSPHPDDECVTGLLPLRLMREAGKHIINVPVTFGSNVERQAERSEELEAACGYLGWDIERVGEGFEPLDTDDIVEVLKKHDPDCVFMPHEDDWNSRHVATHHRVVGALQKMDDSFSCKVVETEFWKPMHSPNLMIEGNAEVVADLVAATALHVGEVARNPYHLRLPAWMQDNVRRGAEIVGGQGGSAPSFSFATLYRLRMWKDGQLQDCLDGGLPIPMDAKELKEVF